jgi:acyl-CoA synthetase (AMP-forming)/AMP-acid ligase II
MSRLTALIDRMFEYGDRPCIEDADVAYSYTQTLTTCLQCDASFDKRNIQPGCVIGLQADHSVQSAAVLFAALLRACIVVLIPRDADASALIEEFCIEQLFSMDAEGQLQQRIIGPPKPHAVIDELRGTGQGGIVVFGDNAAGRQEAALQSTESFLARFAASECPFRTLAVLTFDRIGGLESLFYTLTNGGTLIVTRQRDPETICALIESHRVEVLPASPDFLRIFCATALPLDRDLSSLKVITTGSEAVDATTLGLIQKLLPHVRIAQGRPAISSIPHVVRNRL